MNICPSELDKKDQQLFSGCCAPDQKEEENAQRSTAWNQGAIECSATQQTGKRIKKEKEEKHRGSLHKIYSF